MPRPARLHELTPEQEHQLNMEIQARHFCDFKGLAAWLDEKGWFDENPPGPSVLQRHGVKLKRKLETIKAATEAARLINDAAPDDADYRSAAVMSMVQSELFDLMISLQEVSQEDDPAARADMMSKITRAVADLSRASVSHKKYQAEVKTKIGSAFNTLEKEAKAGQRKIDHETLRIVREQVYGLV